MSVARSHVDKRKVQEVTRKESFNVSKSFLEEASQGGAVGKNSFVNNFNNNNSINNNKLNNSNLAELDKSEIY
jgi:hypothetical protein